MSAGLGVMAAAAILFAYLQPEPLLMNMEKEPEAAPQTKATEPGPADWWTAQASSAQEAGQPDAAAEFRARAAAYLASAPAAMQPATLPDGVVGLPRLAEAALYTREPRDTAPKAVPAALAKFEPAAGTYLGMLGADRRVGFDFSKVPEVYGRKHAIYLVYVGWRKYQTDTSTYFPKRQADRVKELGGALQIGWEPRYGLADVLDDEYVRTFAREAKTSGIPIFLRYASEMNGAWVPWHGDPKLYIEKWRMIHDIMAEEAPNVAMVWSPNFAPTDQIDEYYPGDAYVDWVGFSLYSTPPKNEKDPEELRHTMIDDFAPLYAKYGYKPIMISEGAVGHTVLKTNTSYTAWAEAQLGYMYAYLPRLFPQVKGITYFNFSKAGATRTGMEYVYDLGENALMDGLYKRQIRSDWFLSQVGSGSEAVSYRYVPVSSASLPQGKHTVLMYARTADGSLPFAVALYKGNQRIGISYEMPWEVQADVAADSSSEPWRIVAYNQQMQPIATGTSQAKPKPQGKELDALNKQLIAAAERGDTKLVLQSIQDGASINFQDDRGRTPIMAATHGNKPDTVKALIQAGADINLQDNLWDNPFLYAGAEGLLDIVKLMIDAGADPKLRNRYGGSALIPAAERGHVAVVKELLERSKVDVNHINNLGWTALLEAIVLSNGDEKHQQIVQLLVDHGADVNIADKDGVTPLQHAKKRQFTEIERILTKAGAH
ncbi:hypothetical protein FPZ49_15075 [Paenibacillus cremeus]|uniref:GH26 domain-containing protein n=2 Tax=Paenibacillus cremeus TaxID=2163881 RepID=A0A559KAG7_9BACL|nr:hypothetical protein FPZ49_15075 [Paenibacillus cremeus]